MNDETDRVQTPTTIALAIPWCPWIPERVESMARLCQTLGIDMARQSGPCFDVREFTEKLPNDQWSEQVWGWLVQTGADWCLQLQEDALVPENFWGALYALLESLPPEADIVGLQVAHPIATVLAGEDARLFTTADALVGVGYVVRRTALAEFLEWRARELKDDWREPIPPKDLPSITEDTMLGLFAMASGRRIYHPIPAIVDHDVSMKSVWGNDDHPNRTSSVTWRDAVDHDGAWTLEDLEAPGFWMGRFKRVVHRAPDGSPLGSKRAYNMDPAVLTGRARIPHVGRFYTATPHLAQRWVKGFEGPVFLQAQRDTGEPEKRRLAYARRAKVDYAARERVLVCTPTRGGTDPRYTSSMVALVQLVEVDVEHGIELLDTWRWHEDLVRVRSRFLRAARETDCTAVHFRDADVACHPRALLGMLAANRDFVATPYPRRSRIDWQAVVKAAKEGDPRPLQSVAYEYNFHALPDVDLVLDEHECLEMASMPLGCSVVRRGCFERMIDYYDALDRKRVDLEHVAREVARTPSRSVLERILRELAGELAAWRAGHMGLRFTDLEEGKIHETVALFQLMPRGPEGARPLMSEDASFCQRLRDMPRTPDMGPKDGRVWMYLGPGAPADHVGEHVFEGKVEAFGLQRLTVDELRAAERAQRERTATQ